MENHQSGFIGQLLKLISVGEENGAENAYAKQVKDFLDEIPGGFLIYNANGGEEILYANKELLRIFKCASFEEFMAHTGGSFRGVVHPEDLNEVENSIAEQIKLSADDMDYVEYRIICKDGSVRRIEDYGHFARTDAGDVFYVFISDATEKINRRLEEQLQRLKVIEGLSVNYDSILYFDFESDTVLPYRLSSRTKEQFNKNWGVRGYNEIIKDYIAQWVHPDDRASVTEKLSLEYMRGVLQDESTYYFNYRCIENGEIIHLQLRIVNVGKKNTANKFVLGFRRIDEEMLREIKQKQALKDALKAAKLADVAKNTFLANMSHDMRTPLNAIFGFSQLARGSLSDEGSVRYYLDRIDEAGKVILELTKKVLEATETTTQDFVLHEAPCDLTVLLSELLETTREKAKKRNLEVTLNTEALEHKDVLADENKIKDVLDYLLGNAVKYNKKDGKIEITATEKAYGGNLRRYEFAVTDTGVGIDENALDRIFAPFERERDTTESGVSGVGLGLTLARHGAEMMGGTITVKSVKGEGSTFTLSLNLRLAESDEEAGGEGSAESLTGLKILLVEDNEINLEIATDILAGAGYTVDAAENGKIAVEKIKNSPVGTYDVVLMDIQMPVMDGRTATDKIRALDGERAKIPVIALSANAFERDKQLSLAHGMNAHLTKPLDLELIQRTIAEILHKK